MPSVSNSGREIIKDISLALFFMAWAVICMFAGQFIVAYPMYWILGETVAKPAWTLLYYILNYSVALVLLILVPYWLKQIRHKSRDRFPEAGQKLGNDLATNATEMGVDKWPTFVDLGLAPIAYIAYLVFAGAITRIMSGFSWFDSEQAQDVGFDHYGGRIYALIAIVFIAPIAEELILRGWLYGKLHSKLQIWAAILLTSVLFGLLHGQWNVGVSTFILSIILCSLREVTGSIWSGMLVHILMNGVAFYLLFVADFVTY